MYTVNDLLAALPPSSSNPPSPDTPLAAVCIATMAALDARPAPQSSILLNRDDPVPLDNMRADHQAAGGPTLIKSVKDAFSFDSLGRTAVHKSAINPARDLPGTVPLDTVNSHSSSSSASTTFSMDGVPSSPRTSLKRSQSVASRRPPSPCISFAPLPEVPRLERRRSIALGVSARSDLLRTQGGRAAPRPGNAPGTRSAHGKDSLMMTDAEWDDYQHRMSGGVADAPPLHHLIKSGFKTLGRRARSLSNSSRGSSESRSPYQDSVSPLPSSASPVLPRPGTLSTADTSRDDVMSDFGSIQEEPEEEKEDNDVTDAVDDGMEVDTSEWQRDRSGSAEGKELRDVDEEEESGQPGYRGRTAGLPSYLRRDLSAERRHYAHLPPDKEPLKYRTADLDSPMATPRRRNSDDAEDFGAHQLSHRLAEMAVEDGHAGGRGRGGSGEQTPRGHSPH